MENKKIHPKVKSSLHPRNKHRSRYDFEELKSSLPELTSYVNKNEYGDESIDFFDPKAVKALNKSLIQHYYNIKNWDIPKGYLCPPVPGRADYIHHAADLFGTENGNTIPKGKHFKCFDIGIGANAIYPIIGIQEYGWSFTGSEVDDLAIVSVNNLLDNNPNLSSQLVIRKQKNAQSLLKNVIYKDEKYDLVICNPPFHSSKDDAISGTIRKLTNLTGKKEKSPHLNFGGQNNELWCEGGELAFIEKLIAESKDFRENCFWFTTLVSRQSHILSIEKKLRKLHPFEIKTIPMGQGNKVSRIIAWTFLSTEKQKAWKASQWKKT